MPISTLRSTLAWPAGGGYEADPTFYQLHLLFDKHYGEQGELVDLVGDLVLATQQEDWPDKLQCLPANPRSDPQDWRIAEQLEETMP